MCEGTDCDECGHEQLHVLAEVGCVSALCVLLSFNMSCNFRIDVCIWSRREFICAISVDV